MKIKLIKSILIGGKRYEEGAVLTVDDQKANAWIEKGFCKKFAKKESKEVIETKEFKTEKLTKDATN